MPAPTPKKPPPAAALPEVTVGSACGLMVERSADGMLWKATLIERNADGSLLESSAGWKRREKFNADLLLLRARFGSFVLQGIGRPLIG